MHAEMRPFAERNTVVIGAIGLCLTAALTLGALEFKKLLFFTTTEYSAYFADASGLLTGEAVRVSGVKAGEVKAISLEGQRVRVVFDVDKNIHLRDRTEAAIRTKSVLGTKFLEVTSRGQGALSGPIPLERTTPAYQLADALGDLATTVGGLDTDQLNRSLMTLSDTFKDTPAGLQVAVKGLARFSQTLNERDTQIRGLLQNADKATAVLAKRSDQVVGLVNSTDALLSQLLTQRAALDQLSGNINSLASQVSGFISDNRSQMRPALDKLNGVLTIVDNQKERLQKSLKLLNKYALSLGETVGSGPFFFSYVANLIPGQFIQPFVDAAFSDLGLDPHTLLPSQRFDPQTGQKATPPLPMPYPRTGQGGEPRKTLPDAITGNPDQKSCGPAGIPLPGPGCYPYREPLPAPPPGGAPPGPPASVPPAPQPTRIYTPAPNEVPPSDAPKVSGSR